MTEDQELADWTAAWRRTDPPAAIDPVAISRAVRRRTVWIGVAAAVEISILLGMLALLIAFSRSTRDPWDWGLVVAFSALIVVGLHRTVTVLRRTWRAPDHSTRAFLDLMVLRTETQLQQIRFGWGILAVELVVFVPWIWHRTHSSGLAISATSYGALATVASAAAVILVVMKRRHQGQLRHWRALRRDFQD